MAAPKTVPITTHLSLSADTKFEDVRAEVEKEVQENGGQRPKKAVIVNLGQIFKVVMDVSGYESRDLTVTWADNKVTIEGKSEMKSFKKSFTAPSDSYMDQTKGALSNDGYIVFSVPREGTANVVTKSTVKSKTTKITIQTKEEFSKDTFFSRVVTTYRKAIKQTQIKYKETQSITDEQTLIQTLQEKNRTDKNQVEAIEDDEENQNIVLDVNGYKSDDLEITYCKETHTIHIDGSQKTDSSSKSFTKMYVLNKDYKLEETTAGLSSDGILVIKVPKTEEYRKKVTSLTQTTTGKVELEDTIDEVMEDYDESKQETTQVEHETTTTKETTTRIKITQKTTVITEERICKIIINVSGYNKKDINIQATSNNEVTITGQAVTEINGKKVIKKFTKTYKIPHNVNIKETTIEIINNQLVLIVPKKDSPTVDQPAAVQPAAPASQPAAPAPQPATPPSQSSPPAPQPAAPVQQPAAPVQQPAAPAPQPAAPAPQPAAPAPQPAAPAPQPAAPAPQPAAPSPQYPMQPPPLPAPQPDVLKPAVQQETQVSQTSNTNQSENVTQQTSQNVTKTTKTVTKESTVTIVQEGDETTEISDGSYVPQISQPQPIAPPRKPATPSPQPQAMVPQTTDNQSVTKNQSSTETRTEEYQTGQNTVQQGSTQVSKKTIIQESTMNIIQDGRQVDESEIDQNEMSRIMAQVQDISNKMQVTEPSQLSDDQQTSTTQQQQEFETDSEHVTITKTITRTVTTSNTGNVSLATKGDFYQDNFFEDTRSIFENALKNTMNQFNETKAIQDEKTLINTLREKNFEKEKNPDGTGEDNNVKKIVIDVKGYRKENLNVSILDETYTIKVSGKQEDEVDGSFSSKSFNKTFILNSTYNLKEVKTGLSSDGILTLKVPRVAGESSVLQQVKGFITNIPNLLKGGGN